MTARIHPVDAVNGAPLYSGRALRQLQVAPLAFGATPARPLGGRSGVRPGTSRTGVILTTTQWTVPALAGLIDGEAASEAGPYEFAFDAPVSGPLNAASSNPRVDLVSITVSDPAENDGSTVPKIDYTYTPGAPAASGAAAPATPARSFPVLQINVPTSGTPTYTWVAPYAVAAGGVLPIDTLASLALLAAGPGTQAWVYGDALATNNGLWTFTNATDGAWAGANGWIPTGGGAAVVTTAGTVASAFAPASDLTVSRTGNTVTLHFGGTKSSAFTTFYTMYRLPVGFRPPSNRYFTAVLTTTDQPGVAEVRIYSDGTINTGRYMSNTAASSLFLDCSFSVV